MKFGDLCSIAHNFADSFGSGASLLFNDGVRPFAEAAKNPGGGLEVDLLNGLVLAGDASPELRRSLSQAPRFLSDFCERHHESSEAFRVLTVRYLETDAGAEFAVTVQDQSGRTRTDVYSGNSGKRILAGKYSMFAIREGG